MSLKFGCVILFIKVITHLLLSKPFDSTVFCKQKKIKFEGNVFTESVKAVANTYNDILMTFSPLQKQLKLGKMEVPFNLLSNIFN